MSSFTPAPQFLPFTATITIPSKNMKITNVHVSPTDTPKDLKNLLISKFEKQGDPISEFTSENLFMLQNSPVGGTPTKPPTTTSVTASTVMDITASSSYASSNSQSDSVILSEESVPIAQFQPEPGCTLVLLGKLKCKR